MFVIDEADIPDKDFEVHVLLVGRGNEETLDTWLNGERYATFWIQGSPLVAIIVTSSPRPQMEPPRVIAVTNAYSQAERRDKRCLTLYLV